MGEGATKRGRFGCNITPLGGGQPDSKDSSGSPPAVFDLCSLYVRCMLVVCLLYVRCIFAVCTPYIRHISAVYSP